MLTYESELHSRAQNTITHVQHSVSDNAVGLKSVRIPSRSSFSIANITYK